MTFSYAEMVGWPLNMRMQRVEWADETGKLAATIGVGRRLALDAGGDPAAKKRLWPKRVSFDGVGQPNVAFSCPFIYGVATSLAGETLVQEKVQILGPPAPETRRFIGRAG